MYYRYIDSMNLSMLGSISLFIILGQLPKARVSGKDSQLFLLKPPASHTKVLT